MKKKFLKLEIQWCIEEEVSLRRKSINELEYRLDKITQNEAWSGKTKQNTEIQDTHTTNIQLKKEWNYRWIRKPKGMDKNFPEF